MRWIGQGVYKCVANYRRCGDVPGQVGRSILIRVDSIVPEWAVRDGSGTRLLRVLLLLVNCVLLRGCLVLVEINLKNMFG